MLKPLVGGRPGSGAFASTAWLPEADARQLVGAIEDLGPKIALWVAAPEFEQLAYRIVSELGRARAGQAVGVGKDVVLDFAAELLALADHLHALGRSSTAFALEGIEGRLMEALVGGELPAGVTSPSSGGAEARGSRPVPRGSPTTWQA